MPFFALYTCIVKLNFINAFNGYEQYDRGYIVQFGYIPCVYILFHLGDSGCQLSHKRSWTQCRDHFIDGRMCVRRMLDAYLDSALFPVLRRLPRLWRRDLQLQRVNGTHQQLCESIPLRRQVPRISGWSETSQGKNEPKSAAESSCRCHLTCKTSFMVINIFTASPMFQTKDIISVIFRWRFYDILLST